MKKREPESQTWIDVLYTSAMKPFDAAENQRTTEAPSPLPPSSLTRLATAVESECCMHMYTIALVLSINPSVVQSVQLVQMDWAMAGYCFN